MYKDSVVGRLRKTRWRYS